LASHAALYPLVLLLLAAEWVVLFAGIVSVLATVPLPEPLQRRHAVALAAGPALVAVVASALLSPGPPVLSTYTGLAHVTSAYHIADMHWSWAFSPDYPLAVQTLAALFVTLLGHSPEAFSAANTLLFALGAGGSALLALVLFRSAGTAAFAGLVAAILPFGLLFAGGDGLSVGYFALGPWAMLLFVRHAQAPAFSGWSMLAASSCLALLLQTRPEAAAFFLPLVVVVLVASQALGRTLVSLAGAALLAAPFGFVYYSVMVESGRASGELGVRLVPGILIAAGILSTGILLVSGLRSRPLASPRTAGLVGAGLFAAWLAAMVAVYGPGFVTPGPLCALEGCTASTYLTVPFWPLNPKVVPLPIVALALVGLLPSADYRADRIRAGLVVWLGLLLAAASTKATGELPLDGARTQLPAVVPLLLLAAAGTATLAPRIKVRWLLLVCVVAAIPSALQLRTLDFDDQQEFRFVRSCLPKLPDKSVLYAPDDRVDILLPGDEVPLSVDLYALFRLAFLAESLGDEARGIRIAEAGQLPANPPPHSYFLRGLGCRRTGSRTTAPSCAAVQQKVRLEPVCETTVTGTLYASDFVDVIKIVGEPPVIGIYEIKPLGGSNAIP